MMLAFRCFGMLRCYCMGDRFIESVKFGEISIPVTCYPLVYTNMYEPGDLYVIELGTVDTGCASVCSCQASHVHTCWPLVGASIRIECLETADHCIFPFFQGGQPILDERERERERRRKGIQGTMVLSWLCPQNLGVGFANMGAKVYAG